MLVAALSKQWGWGLCAHGSSGKIVWALIGKID